MGNLPTNQCCATLALALLLTSTASAGTGPEVSRAKLSSDLASQLNVGGPGSVDVIVQTDSSSLDSVRSHLRLHGSAVGRTLRSVDGLAASVPLSELDAVAADRTVRHISLDRRLAAAMNVAGPSAGWSRGMAPQTGGPTGRGVGVAVIDSGIYPHEDINDAVVARVDFVDPTRNGSELAKDPYGHGTHVAGIIAGRAVPSPNGDGFFGGLAPGAHLISLRVLDHKGSGKSSDVIAALEWCEEHQAEFGIRVVNLSLGQAIAEPFADDPLDQAVERAWRAGLVVVSAAGNAGMIGNGYGTISSPANDPLVIAVGALDDRGTVDRRDDETALFSSRGPTRFDFILKPDLLAPGTRIVSLRVPQSTLDRSLPDARVALNSAGQGRAFEPRYFEMSGSSMSTAMVSGAAAIMLETDPTLSPDDVKARLMRHAEHLGAQDIYTRGAGAIDVGMALLGDEHVLAAASPAISVTAASAAVVIGDTGAAWGDASLWSLEQLYGDPALWNVEVAQTMSLFDDVCMTGQGVTWQHAVADGVTWQHSVDEEMLWQTLTSEGVTWQHLKGSGVTWQHSYGDGSCPY